MTDRIAASAAQAAVQTAVNAASDGDRVLIPDGSATWTSGISTTKQIQIRAQNYTPTYQGSATRSVTITDNCPSAPLITMQSGNSYHARITGIKFLTGSAVWCHVKMTGTGSKIGIIDDCLFDDAGTLFRGGDDKDVAMVRWATTGGLMFNCRMVADADSDPSSMLFKVDGERAWNTASTMGMLDTNGTQNVYLEDSTFVNIGVCPDIDANARVVARHCIFDGSCFKQHGLTTNPGGRHSEAYDNVFQMTQHGDTYWRNLGGYYCWVRGGTMLLADNSVTYPTQYNYPSCTFLIIGEHSAPSGGYPMTYQCGWGHSGSGYAMDPIYMWGNTGAYGNTQGWINNWQTYCNQGEVVINGTQYGNGVINAGPKPNYTKYTYNTSGILGHPVRRTMDSGGTPPTGVPVLSVR